MALSLSRMPAKRWATRADLIVVLEAARVELEQNPDKVRLVDLASQVGLSPFHLQRLFQATFGESPRAYGERVRLLRAWTELASGARVGDTALQLGYATPQALTRAFRRVFDLAPSQVRLDVLNQAD